jgi:nucleotide-binding universal stress UspA family protein
MYRHILVAFNGSAGATRALTTALDLARNWGSELRVLCVAAPPLILPPVSGWELLAAQLSQEHDLGRWLGAARELSQGHGVAVRFAVGQGRPAPTIARYAARRGSDLLIIGQRQGGWVRKLGGMAGRIARLAPCPVLIVA